MTVSKFALAALAVVCACGRQPANKPLTVERPKSGLSRPGSSADNETLVRKTIDPQYFVPLLSDKRIEAVRYAIEERDDELAAKLLRTVLVGGAVSILDGDRLQYLLGTVEERRGLRDSALLEFQKAAGLPGALQTDAWRHVASLALDGHDCFTANRALRALQNAGVAEREALALSSEISVCSGDDESAKRAVTSLILSSKSSRERARNQLRLAELLAANAESCDERSSSVRSEVSSLASGATEILADVGSGLARAATVMSKVVCPKPDSLNVALREEALRVAERLIESRRFSDAKTLLANWKGTGGVETLPLEVTCKFRFILGQLDMSLGAGGDAIESLEWLIRNCGDGEQTARAYYLAGGKLSARGKVVEAIAKYSELERRFPSHRLADDAHLKSALLYRSMGSEKRFVELLDSMPELYPSGDMTQEGLFLLALRSMQMRDWGAAHSVLERALSLSQVSRVIRDQEQDRLQYFLAQAKHELSDNDGAKALWHALILSRPLSYYMLLAYSALWREDPEVARNAVASGVQAAKAQTATSLLSPNSFAPEIQDILVLLAVADLKSASRQMEDVSDRAAVGGAISLMTGLYLEAGATQTALALSKSRPELFRNRWPVGSWATIWQVAYPVPFRQIVRRESAVNNLSEFLVYAIMREESEFDPTAISHANAYGLMQLIVPTAVHIARGTGLVATPHSLLVPATNIALGSRELAKLLEQFKGQEPLAIAGYNAGPGRPQRWLREHPDYPLDLWVESIEFAETRNYVKRVLSSLAVYQWLYAADDRKETIAPLALTLLVQ